MKRSQQPVTHSATFCADNLTICLIVCKLLFQCFVFSHDVELPKIIKEEGTSLRICKGPICSPKARASGPEVQPHAGIMPQLRPLSLLPPQVSRQVSPVHMHASWGACCLLRLLSSLLIILTRFKLFRNLRIHQTNEPWAKMALGLILLPPCLSAIYLKNWHLE